MGKRHEHNPDQSVLFQLPAAGHDVREGLKTWHDQPTPVTYGPEGSYVDVSARAVHLKEALGALSARNQRSGFGDAVHLPPHDSEIWGRYRSQTPRVAEGAQANETVFLDKAKREFWRSTGIAALKDTGLANEEQARAHGRTVWREFYGQFGGSGEDIAKARNRQKRKHEKQIKYVHRVIDKKQKAA